MKQKDAKHTITIDSSELERLTLSQMDETQDERQEQQQHTSRPQKAFFLTHGAENEVSVLFRHETQLGLRAIEKPLAPETAGTNGYLALVNIITCSSQVFIKTKQHIDPHTLMGLHDIVEHIVGTIEKRYGTYRKQAYQKVMVDLCGQSCIDQISN